MSIIQYAERLESGTAKLDRSGYATYTRVIQLICSDYTTRQGAAITFVRGLVDIGDPYIVLDVDNVTVLESDSGAFVTDMSAALGSGADDGCTWDVTINYGPAGGEVATFPQNPLDHPLELSWGSQQIERTIEVDVNGDAIVNSAYDFFVNNPPTRPTYKIQLNITRNEASFAPIYAQSYKGTLNAGAFTVAGASFAAGYVKCADITAKAAYHPDCGWYWQVSYVFEMDPDGWKYRPIDMGTSEWVAGKKRAITDDNGELVSEPVMLNGSGAKAFGTASPQILEFDIYPTSNFDDFNFDYTNAPGY